MLAVAYLFSCYLLPLPTPQYHLHLLRIIQNVIGFAALCGLVPFAVQFLVGPGWMFPFDHLLATNWFIPNFNLRIPLVDGLAVLKSTGLWSWAIRLFSDHRAGHRSRIRHFRRIWLLTMLALGYRVSFSGTGLLLLFGTAYSVDTDPPLRGPYGDRLGGRIAVLCREIPPFSYTPTASPNSAIH